MAESSVDTTATPKTLGLLAEFPGPDELVAAAAKTTDSGYRKVEAFSPFPIHGIDEALKAKKTILPWLVFFCGLTGCIIAQLMQQYMNGVEGPWMFSGYEYRISGKPYFSVPSSIPVTFELIVLLSAFGSFFGMWALNGLPMLSNPLFKSERFKTATSHGFFLWIDAKDAKFNESESASYLQSIGATGSDVIQEETQGRDLPTLIHIVGAVSTAIALVPPLWIAAASGESSLPRLSIWWCMDYQPKSKAQTTSNVFADGRSMRKAIPGTVPRGGLTEDMQYYRGIDSLEMVPIETASASRNADVQFVNLLQNEAAPEGEGGGGGEEQAPIMEPDYTSEFPEQLEITSELMDRGQLKYNIYCATCHGLGGDGDGLITKRAMALQQIPAWTPPTSIHSTAVRDQPVGRIYDTIAHGRRQMPGYAQQISVKDRWAIVLYLQALQKHRTATIDEVPESQRDSLR